MAGNIFSDGHERSDALRTKALEAKGFHVVRFTNTDVLTNRDGVLETIAAVLAERAPTPALPRKRERGPAVPC